jgi:hypothetical protein
MADPAAVPCRRKPLARKVDVFLAVGNELALRAALSAADGKPIASCLLLQFPIRKGHVEARRLQPPSNSTLGVRNEHESVLFGKGGFAF